MSIPSGASVGSVVVDHKLASDLLGELSLARQPALDRPVVLRRLRRDLLGSELLVDRFQREARFAAKLIHPNIVQVFDCFAYAGDRYLVVEHVEGTNLREVLERAGSVPPRVALHLARELSRGLVEVHARRVVHADLRPEHVKISRWGDVKLSGFACARELGKDGPPVEASPYRAPEAAGEKPISWAADSFALGVILLQMLSGEARVGAHDRDVPRALRRFLRGCTHADPERRPAMREVLQWLTRRVGNASAADSRSEIGAWLWEARIFRPSSEHPDRERLAARAPARPRAARRWGLGAAVAAASVLLAFLILREPPDASAPGTATAAEPSTPEVSAGPETLATALPQSTPPAWQQPGFVSFVAYPWAEVQVDQKEKFLLPRAEPLPLAPGEHEVVFRHPRFGEERRTVVVAAGEHQRVNHVFAYAGRSK